MDERPIQDNNEIIEKVLIDNLSVHNDNISRNDKTNKSLQNQKNKVKKKQTKKDDLDEYLETAVVNNQKTNKKKRKTKKNDLDNYLESLDTNNNLLNNKEKAVKVNIEEDVKINKPQNNELAANIVNVNQDLEANKVASSNGKVIVEDAQVITENTKKKRKKKKKKQEDEIEDKSTKVNNADVNVKSKKPTGKGPSKEFIRRAQEAVAKQREQEEAKRLEEEKIKKALQEAEERIKQEEILAEEMRLKKKLDKKERLKKLKEDGVYVTKKQKEDQLRIKEMLNHLKEQGVEVPDVGKKTDIEQKAIQKVVYKKQKKTTVKNEELSVKNEINDPHTNINEKIEKEIDDEDEVPDNWEDLLDNSESTEEIDIKPVELVPVVTIKPKAKKTITLRSPIICVMGHVDTGKTKILDKLRLTNVQTGEAGGITQQIGVTNVSKKDIKNTISKLPYMSNFKYFIPGLLLIDTPGHESFRNLRNRGSSLCDVAILVVDLMHGIEPQTLESFQILMDKKVPFVIALNKIDRLYGWKSDNAKSILDNIQSQEQSVKNQYTNQFDFIKTQFAEKGVNIALYDKWSEGKGIMIPVVPTSAHTGEGIADLVAFIVSFSQKFLIKRLSRTQKFQANVMEVKSVTGMGMVIDVILINGSLKDNDTIVLSSIDGPVVTQIRSITIPQPMTDIRASKGNFIRQTEISESQGIRISAGSELDGVLAGLPVLKLEEGTILELLKEEAENNLTSVLNTIQLEETGVYVQASTLGSLEALLEFLKQSKVPYSGVNIGPVHKKDVLKASVMLEKNPNFAVILAFDVKVEVEAQQLAKKENVKIFTADIIYHLFDAFTEYTKQCKAELKEKFKSQAIFPCRIKILKEHIYNKRDPIIFGVSIEKGSLRVGSPIVVPSKNFTFIGTIASIELNEKPVEKASTGQQVCIKIVNTTGEAPKALGRHFDENDMLVTRITRESIDILKEYFKEEMQKNDWLLIIELKKEFGIV